MFSSSSSSIPLLSFPPTLKSPTPRKSPNFPRKIIVASCATTTQNRASCSSVSNMASSASLYEVLGIPMGATCNEIKAAYRRLARTCHPDVVAMNQKETSACEFMKIHSAYSTLSDPNKRAQYDREIYGHHRKPLDYSSLTSANIASMTSGYHRYAHSGMKWETDQCW